jgi:hypothetical protein
MIISQCQSNFKTNYILAFKAPKFIVVSITFEGQFGKLKSHEKNRLKESLNKLDLSFESN